MNNKSYAIIFVLVVVGVIVAGIAVAKFGMNNYEEYAAFEGVDLNEYKKAA